MTKWRIADINRARIPLVILWAEQQAWINDLVHEITVHTCVDCHRVYHPAPSLCISCGLPVCDRCVHIHRKGHWNQVKTIGGDILCDGDKVRCGRDQCPKCNGSPF